MHGAAHSGREWSPVSAGIGYLHCNKVNVSDTAGQGTQRSPCEEGRAVQYNLMSLVNWRECWRGTVIRKVTFHRSKQITLLQCAGAKCRDQRELRIKMSISAGLLKDSWGAFHH